MIKNLGDLGKISGLNIIGPHKGVSGYDHHVRSFVTQLLALGIDIHLKDVANWSETILPESFRPKWDDTLDKKIESDIYLHFCMPHQMEIQEEGVNVLFTMFEADRIPISWVEPSKKADLLILPTQSSKASWQFRGIAQNKIHLCPLGIDPELFAPNWPPLNIQDDKGKPVSDYSFRFLNISELRPRKNLMSLIRVWMKTTTMEDDAILILKVGGLQEGFYETFLDDLKTMQESLGIDQNNFAPIHFIQEILPTASMARLYRTATHYISMSHGEGWDMPMMEAGAAGLTLIAPLHSAYATYLNNDIAHLIPSQKIPVRFDGQLGIEDIAFFSEANWWEPSEEIAASIIRKTIDRTLASKLSPRSLFLENYSWKNATQELMKILTGIGGN